MHCPVCAAGTGGTFAYKGDFIMPFIRQKRAASFTIVPNSIFTDENLNLRDVGLLCFLLHLPDNWEFTVNGLVASLPNDGKDAITSSLKRIENAGYLRRERTRTPDGKLSDASWIISDSPMTENPAQVNPPQKRTNRKKELNSKEISGMVDYAERIDSTHAPDPAVSERPVYPHVQTVDPKKRITRKMCVELFGEPATDDAKTLVDNYIDRYYAKYRGAQHPEVSHAARYAYAYRLLLCSVEMGQRSLELVDDALLCAVRKEKGYDPTIYLVTRPHALGHWMLQCGDMTFDLICGERYDFVNNTTPDLDPFPVRQAEVFRKEYTGSNYK